MQTQFKKYRILYTFNHSKMGFNNSITVYSINVDKAINEAIKQVQEVYGSNMMKRFSFKPDPIMCGVA